WEEVENADSYVVTIDGTNEYEVNENTFDLSPIISTLAGNHSITVKSKTANPNIELDTEVTTVYKEVYLQLDDPTNIKVTQVDNFVKVSFDAVQNALSYTVTVNGTTLFPALTQTSFDYDIKENYELENTLKFTITANANGFYTQSSAVESSTFRFIQYLKTPVIKSITTNKNGDKVMTLEVTKIDTNIKIYLQDTINLDITIDNPTTSITVLLTDYLEDNGEYNIQVQSIAYNNNYLKDSEISPIFSYINNVPFPAPQILDINTGANGAYITVSWEPVANVENYRLFVNDVLYITTPMTQYQVSKAEIQELAEGGYNFNVQAVGVDGSYTDSVLGENTYYKGYDGLDKVSGINVANSTNGFTVSWRAVENAEKYSVFVNNEQFDTTLTSYEYQTTQEKPYQIIIKACAENDEDSSYSAKIMHNTTSVTLPSYTTKYVYFNGWHDFYIENIEEFNTICKYSFYSYKSIDIFVNQDSGITYSNFIDKYKDAMKDFGTSSLSISYPYTLTTLGGVSGTIFNITLTYLEDTQNPALTSTNSAYSTFENQAYYKLETPTRSETYNDFATEKSLIEVEVSNTNELYIAVEGGAKPVFATNNYEAKECYEEAKEILRNIISDDMTDFEKSLAIYDYINYISVYDSNYANGIMNDRRYWLNGPLLGGVGVCDGLSKLYSLLANLEGLQTKRITGYCLTDSGLEKLENNETILESDKTGHAWNKTFIDADGDGDKEWYNLDITWDGGFLVQGQNNETYELLSHRYFLLSDEQFANHYAYVDQTVAETEFNYYEKFDIDESGNDLYITSLDELVEYLKILRDNETLYNGIDIKVDIQGEEDIDEILRNARYVSGIGFSYYSDEDGTCFIFKTL
ncbi:MAG: hypothetical protein IJW82_01650, partial [Clostridia bacterium]|nr:hypothetical protein [Clostridia bacterium]